ncbi:M67 family metallopeptidase [Spirochaetia bacterium 38H-sp]|uniref:M67 family metallopeptidase n=1 Tax=Rarispira pelagica TaxID=3141764 RepID=A0ABU9U9S2_9SPIR
MKISREIYQGIAEHSISELPNEACGYIAGKGDTAEKQYRLTNADASCEHFSFIPEEQFATLKDARKHGLALIAVYHSHPSTPARMSDEDIRLANDTEMRYLIYSVKEKSLKCFRIDDNKNVTEEELIILEM